MNVPKRLLATALLLVLVAGIAAAAFAKGQPGDSVPRVVILSKTANVGNVLEGQDVVYTFKIKNLGIAELQILSVKPG